MIVLFLIGAIALTLNPHGAEAVIEDISISQQ